MFLGGLVGARGLEGWGLGAGGPGGWGGAGGGGWGPGVGSVHRPHSLQMFIVFKRKVLKALATAVLWAHIALNTLGTAYGWSPKYIGQWS